MNSVIARDYRSGQPLHIRFAQTKVLSVAPVAMPANEIHDLPFIAPGLFDIQVNGYHGLWFCSETLTVDETCRIVQALVERGIARCFPTLITSSFEAMQHGLQTIRKAAAANELVASVVRGIHLEGPYISRDDGPRGAHPLQHVRRADYAEFCRWQTSAENTIRLVTVAPEAEGAIDFIHAAVGAGVRVSIGHTAATAEQIAAAADAGATLSTHLGNGCAALLHRHSNILWSQLADDRLTASVIADGWHLPAAVLTSFLRCKSPERLLLTCDVSGYGGCSPGLYNNGNVQVEVLEDGRIVVAGQRQYLAGSGATTGDCVAQMMHCCGLSLADAWDMAAERPASLFGEPACRLQPAQEATLTLFRLSPRDETPAFPAAVRQLAPRFEPVATMVQGRLVSGQIS